MDIICEHCNTKLSISDDKIPSGKKVAFLCPKCRQKIHIIPKHIKKGHSDNKNDFNASAEDIVSASPINGENTDYDAEDKPFDFLEEDARTALICMQDGESRKMLENAFSKMKYHFISVNHAETALTRMKYHLFDYIIIHDKFDMNHLGASNVLNYIKNLSMNVRRRIFVVLISGKYHTADNMATFNESLNLIINEKDIRNMEKIFFRNLREYEKFYSVFNDSIKKAVSS